MAKIRATPKAYYAAMSDEELVSTFSAHFAEHIPVPDFLCSELEKRDCTDALLTLLSEGDGETVLYVINLIGADERAFPVYFSLLTERRTRT